MYWLSRYLERAENTARIIGVNTNLLLDLPGGIAPGWLPLVDISGSRAAFDQQYQGRATRGEERDIRGAIAHPVKPTALMARAESLCLTVFARPWAFGIGVLPAGAAALDEGNPS